MFDDAASFVPTSSSIASTAASSVSSSAVFGASSEINRVDDVVVTALAALAPARDCFSFWMDFFFYKKKRLFLRFLQRALL